MILKAYTTNQFVVLFISLISAFRNNSIMNFLMVRAAGVSVNGLICYRAREFFIYRPKCVYTRGQHVVLELVYGCNQNMQTSTDLIDRWTIRLTQNKRMMT